MSGFAAFPGSDVRKRVDHPVIDADAHVVESNFAFLDFLKVVAGPEMVERFQRRPGGGGGGPTVKGFWWGLPSGPHTADRAMALLPRYFRSKLDATGIDFAHCYTTAGLGLGYAPEDDVRQACCRALNMLYAEMFAEVGDRLRPVAVIPTYSPAEALAELEFAVGTLGHKAIMIGTEMRGPPRPVSDGNPMDLPTQWTRSIIMDSPHDFDPFWRRCIELKVAPVCHTSSRGVGYRASPTNYVFNHLGDFACGAEFFARSLVFSGVTRRFPELTFAFLEGGAGWALNLLNDIVEHWEKRNAPAMAANLDPAKLDIELLAGLYAEFGNERLTGERYRANPYNGQTVKRPEVFDEFAACAMSEVRDLRQLFVDPFYFGCEADDRMTSIAFNRRLNPLGVPLKAMLGSDIGHWDVMDATSILSEAWSLVEAKLISEADFRSLCFVNPAMLHLSMNPDYFVGTVIEDHAKTLLAGSGSSAAPRASSAAR